jgi:hypothetical protein
MTLKKAFKVILDYFEGDYEQTLMWFGSKHQVLGNQAPLVMISIGKKDVLCKFIKSQTEGNKS